MSYDSSTPEQDQAEQPKKKDEKVPFFKVILSVLQASFGVQNSANRERDFTKGNILHYIIAAVLFTALFVIGLSLLVQFVISQA